MKKTTRLEIPKSDEPVARLAGGKQEGTRHFPKCDTKHPLFYPFENYLTDIDRGLRSAKTAGEMSFNVSTVCLW